MTRRRFAWLAVRFLLPRLPMLAMEGNLMGRTRSIHAAWPSATTGGGTSSLLLAAFSWLIPVALVTILLISTPGCANNQRLIELHNGTSCSAENVQAYAGEHGLSYEQALGELRRQDQQLWAEEEAGSGQ